MKTFKNVSHEAIHSNGFGEGFITYINSDINIRSGLSYGADYLYLKSSTLRTETPFNVAKLSLEEGSEATLNYNIVNRKPLFISDIVVEDSKLHMASDVEMPVEEISGYKSIDFRVIGNSEVYLDLRNFDLDSVYLCLNNLSDGARVHILVKDGTKLWVNTKGRVGAYQLRIDGLPKMEVTSM